MNKRFWICGLVMALASLLLDVLIHGLLLRGDYQMLATSGFVRGQDDAGNYVHWMLIAHVFIGYGLTWLYTLASHGRTSSPALGLRFGAAAALLSSVPNYMILYAVQPWPAPLVHKQILLSTAAMLLLGLLLSYLQPLRRAL